METAKTYSWKEGAFDLAKFDAKVLGDELQAIEQRRGAITTEIVEEEARNPTNPFHAMLEWNDTKAAREWRKQQIGRIIRSIKVTIVSVQRDPVEVSAFVSLPNGDRVRSYRVMTEVMAQQDGRSQVLRQAWNELEAWRKRYKHLTELADAMEEVDRILHHKRVG